MMSMCFFRLCLDVAYGQVSKVWIWIGRGRSIIAWVGREVGEVAVQVCERSEREREREREREGGREGGREGARERGERSKTVPRHF